MNAKKDPFFAMDENTVKADGQLKDSQLIRFENASGKGKKIMFVGNSITLHGYREEIGWYGEWGMAASKKENDYVHLLMKKIKKIDPDAAFCICQVANWERLYKEGESTYHLFEDARRFGADMIVMRFIENCPKVDFDGDIFKAEAKGLLSFLDSKNSAEFIITTGFWRHPGDDAIRALAQESGYPLAELGDLGDQDEMKAIGLFEHRGVSMHPGDKGMRAIADRIFEKVLLFL